MERAFRSLKSVDLHVRPIHHRLADRVRANILLCSWAYYVEWHMGQRLAHSRPLVTIWLGFESKNSKSTSSESFDCTEVAHLYAGSENAGNFRKSGEGGVVPSLQRIEHTPDLHRLQPRLPRKCGSYLCAGPIRHGCSFGRD